MIGLYWPHGVLLHTTAHLSHNLHQFWGVAYYP